MPHPMRIGAALRNPIDLQTHAWRDSNIAGLIMRPRRDAAAAAQA